MTVDSEQVQQLWKDLSARLRGWFERQTGNPHDAEDLVQETFLRGHSKLGDLRGPARLGAWTSAIAANVLADHRRQRTRQRVEGSSEEEVMADSAAVSNADENLNAVVAGWVQSFLEQLDPGDAALLRAVELDSRSQAEVARELGLSPSGARSRVQRARARLRERLEACCRFGLDAQGNVTEATRRSRSSCDCD